jgi:hypothetical protein
MMNPTATREQLEHEARAKIFWGDPQDEVVNFLRMNGFTYDEAATLTDGMVGERISAIRSGGIRKSALGLALLSIPVIAWAMMASMGVYSVSLLGIAGAFGLWGAWKLLKGVLMLIFPEMESSDVADQSA